MCTHEILKAIGGILLIVNCLVGLVKSSDGQELRVCASLSQCASVATASLLQMKRRHLVGDLPRRAVITRLSSIAMNSSWSKRSIVADDPESTCLKSIEDFARKDTLAHWEELAREADESETNRSNHSGAALLIIYGLQNRDQKCALPSHLHIRDTLRSMGFMVDTFVYEMRPPQGEKVDGITWSSGSLRDISSTYESEGIAAVDAFIFGKCGENLTSCQYGSRHSDVRYRPPLVVQALRQLYCEQFLADYLRRNAHNAYQVVIAVGLDIYFGSSISPTDIRQAASESNVKDLFLSPNCDCGGYTNGFYMGSAQAVATAMSRFDFSDAILYGNYEQQLKGVADAAGLFVKPLTGHKNSESFRKIRHDGSMKKCGCS